jgi:hypothetical protein
MWIEVVADVVRSFEQQRVISCVSGLFSIRRLDRVVGSNKVGRLDPLRKVVG